jgi:hypothetical protein
MAIDKQRFGCRDGLFVLASVIAMAATLTSCSDIATNELIQTCLSPTGKYQAIAVDRYGGGAAGYLGRFVTIYPASTDVARELQADAAGRPSVFAATGTPNLELTWRGDGALRISFASSSDLTRARHKWTDVSSSRSIILTYTSDTTLSGGVEVVCRTVP